MKKVMIVISLGTYSTKAMEDRMQERGRALSVSDLSFSLPNVSSPLAELRKPICKTPSESFLRLSTESVPPIYCQMPDAITIEKVLKLSGNIELPTLARMLEDKFTTLESIAMDIQFALGDLAEGIKENDKRPNIQSVKSKILAGLLANDNFALNKAGANGLILPEDLKAVKR